MKGLPTLPIIALWIAGLAVCPGCGTGEYQRRLEARVAQIQQVAQFSVLYDVPLPLPGTTVSVRIPSLFQIGFDANTQDPDGGGGLIDPRRLQPPFVTLPGFKLTYEIIFTDSNNNNARRPFYIYMAVATAADAAAGKPVAEAIREQVATQFPSAAWEDVSCTSPTGAVVACKRINVSGPQVFYTGPGQYESLSGVFQLYLHEAQGQHVLIGWRVPDAVSEKANLDQLARLTAGTIVVAAPPAGA